MLPPSPVRILIYGHSDTFGVALADRSRAWPNLVQAELPALIGRPVEVTHRHFANLVLPVLQTCAERATEGAGGGPQTTG